MSEKPTDHQQPPSSRHQSRARLWVNVLLRKHPKYWLLGIILMFCHLSGRLPHPILLWLGRGLGRMVGFMSRRMRHIASANIRACFPHLSAIEQQHLVQRSFIELGMSLMESFKAWFCDPMALFGPGLSVEGESNWDAALASGKGIILVCCHHGCLDMSVTLAGTLVRGRRLYVYTYRQPSDPVIDQFIRDARAPLVDAGLSIRNLVGISRVLKKRGVVWYAPDIEVKNKNTVFVDFMGVPASTTQAVSRIAASAGALVVPYGVYRNADNKSYHLKIWPALAGVPSADARADTAAINRAIGNIIEPFPERYWWVIKRFKHRPEGAEKIY